MIETATLLARLAERDVRLSIEGDRLKCSAPAGALDTETQQLLASRKVEVLAFLRRAKSLDEAPASIVPIKPDGKQPPLFVLSGHGGDVYCLLSLARHLAADQPVLSVQPPGLDSGTPLSSVEALARYEVSQMRQVQPQGPYRIAGHCAGGAIAFEAAQQLIAAGEQVALLALIGSPFPTSFSPLRQRLHRLSGHLRALASGTIAERGKYIADKLHSRMLPPDQRAGAAPALSEARQSVERATMLAVRGYKPVQYPGCIDLFLTADRWHQSELWGKFAGSVRQHVIVEYEINELLFGPNVTLLADVLQRRLASI